MSFPALLSGLVLPPLGLVLLMLLLGIARLRRSPGLAATVVLAASATLVLATPLAAGMLRASLAALTERPHADAAAIVILGAEQRRSAGETDIGPMTLERLRAGARLARTSGLPVLVTAGPLSADGPPLADLMARTLLQDFGIDARWIEARAADTRQNAAFSAGLLAADGIAAVHLVSHAWHLPRAQAAFRRAGLLALPAPVRQDPWPQGRIGELAPRPDHLAESWLMLREWAGLLVYRLRDGPAPAAPAALEAPPPPRLLPRQ